MPKGKSEQRLSADHYLAEMQEAFASNPHAFRYYLRADDSSQHSEGAQRLARELGHGLGASHINEQELQELIGTLYGGFLVKHCLLTGTPVPIDARLFSSKVIEGYREMFHYRHPLSDTLG